jgi:hypothetical protein
MLGPSPGRGTLKMLDNSGDDRVRILLPPPFCPNDFKHNDLMICVLFCADGIHKIVLL